MSFFESIGYNFTTFFFEKGQLLSFYTIPNDKQNSFSIKKSDTFIKTKKIYTVDLVPPFIKLHLKENYNSFKYNYFEGFACNLNGFLNVQDYLTQQQGIKTKKNLNRRIKKLEKCFPITYKVFQGNIAQDIYFDLMASLKSMITIRFKQRNITHGDLGDWDFYTNTCYDLITSKKACLYVIYNGDKPISISINYLSNTIFESAISSYDINYAKFGIGNILVYKKIEWCFENGYTLLNMRWGDYPYKREWCNNVYTYQSHITFNKGSIKNYIKAFFIFLKNIFVLFIIKNKSLINKLNPLNKENKTSIIGIENNYVVIDDYSKKIQKNKVLNLNGKEYHFIKKALIDFQYASNETSENIKIYPQNNNLFFIEGLSKKTLIQYK